MDASSIIGDILKHHGVKGQRWGMRRNRPGGGAPSGKVARKDKKFEKRASSIDTKIQLNNAVTEAMTSHINRINAEFDSKYAKEIDNGVLLNRDHPITKRYHKAYNDAALKELDKEASKFTNASGTRRYKVAQNPDDFLGFTVITVDVKHVDDLNTVRFVYVKDDKGRIVDIKLADDSSLKHISEKPWSDYTEADYTIEQWHSACLIHLHDGPPTSKSQCKLPVKTPNGALNRNGVHAAAAALAGARSPLKAPPDQKTKAASALRGYYSQLGETPPDSLKHTNVIVRDILELEHHGVKGQRWGIRRNRSHPLSTLRHPFGRREVHPDAAAARVVRKKRKKQGISSLSNQEIQTYTQRLNLESNLKSAESRKAKHRNETLKLLGEVGKIAVTEAAKTEAGKRVGAELRAQIKTAAGK